MSRSLGRPRVLVLDDYEGLADSVPACADLQARAQLEIKRTKLSDAELAAALADADVVLLMRERTRVGEADFGRAPALRLIPQPGGGAGPLDRGAATRHEVAVCSTGSDTGTSTIELTMALMLACLRHIPEI